MDIDHLFQEKLQQHNMNPPADAWQKLDLRLDKENTPSTKQGHESAYTSPSKSWGIGKVKGIIMTATALAGLLTTVGIIILLIQSPKPEATPPSTESLTNLKETLHSSLILPVEENEDITIPSNETTPQVKNDNIISLPIIPIETDPIIELDLAQTPQQSTSPIVPTPVQTDTISNISVPTPPTPEKHTEKEEQLASSEPIASPSVGESPKEISSIDKGKILLRELRIPNSVTPNYDGKNDVFLIKGLEKFPNHLLMIFTEKGEVVYQSKSYNNAWDGQNLPSGSYFYTLKVERGDTVALQQGIIYLIRE